jgi:hypothetical protein
MLNVTNWPQDLPWRFKSATIETWVDAGWLALRPGEDYPAHLSTENIRNRVRALAANGACEGRARFRSRTRVDADGVVWINCFSY